VGIYVARYTEVWLVCRSLSVDFNLKNSCSLLYTRSLKRCYVVVKFGETFISLDLTPLTAQKSLFENEIFRVY